MSKLWEMLVRWRTWLLNVLAALMLAMPDLLVILNAPEIFAIVPDNYQRLFAAAVFLLNIWFRPRPAVMAHDPEAEITRQRKAERRGGR